MVNFLKFMHKSSYKYKITLNISYSQIFYTVFQINYFIIFNILWHNNESTDIYDSLCKLEL